MKTTTDIAIIGAGIIGLTSAFQILKEEPKATICIIEKEPGVGMHQTGHNSGVVHSGIYYKPGSLKAKNCVQGRRELLKVCSELNIPVEKVQKLIVATREDELPFLQELYERGVQNQVDSPLLISREDALQVEPNVSAIKAIMLPNAHIINYKKVCETLYEQLKRQGVKFLLNTRVQGISDGKILTSQGVVSCQNYINCAGLFSDRLAKMAGLELDHQIIPFRGEYYFVDRPLVKGLVYPVPNPKFPFLGVHFTKMIDGQLEAGPNAVLALKREGYKKLNISPKDMVEMSQFPGFWKMAASNWRQGMFEMQRSISKRAFLKSLQRLVPAVQMKDLRPGGSGVRAQVVLANGKLADDFILKRKGAGLHVLNAPSPAATASFAIGRTVQSWLSIGG